VRLSWVHETYCGEPLDPPQLTIRSPLPAISRKKWSAMLPTTLGTVFSAGQRPACRPLAAGRPGRPTPAKVCEGHLCHFGLGNECKQPNVVAAI
jgi:hypothetical protein